MSAARFDIDALPLFPLHAVLFPGGLLRLKVFEPRYLDLISRCLRDDETFGVVCLRQGAEVREPVGAEPVRFERVGVLARLQSVDAERPGILELSCVGTQRFQISSPRQQRDGLWLADAVRLDEDPATAPVDGLARTVDALSKAIESLQFRGQRPFLEPYR